METFLPSEIARLVYGYLEEEKCRGAADAFLEGSAHLKECLAVARKGRKFTTRMYGLTLVDILDLLSEALTFVKKHSNEFKDEIRKDSRLLRLIEIDNSSPTNHSNGRSESFSSGAIRNFDKLTSKKEDLCKREGYTSSHEKIEGQDCQPNRMIVDEENEEVAHPKVKVEEETVFGVDEDWSEGDETLVRGLEPEVEISSPTQGVVPGEGGGDAAVGVMSSPVISSTGQLLCQPYGMLQVLAPPTVYLHPPSSAHPPFYQAAVRTSSSNAVQAVWPKPLTVNSQLHRNGSGKLRPIAPKMTPDQEKDPLGDHPLPKRILRSRKKPLRAKNSTASSFLQADRK